MTPYSISKKIKEKFDYYQSLSIIKYIYYNYFSPNIVRKDSAKVIPYKCAILDLTKGARIYLKGKNLEIGANRLKGSKEETRLRMKQGAEWYCNNGCMLVYGTTLEIHQQARLDSGFFYMNYGSTIICTKHITVGEDVWMGRNITIYDSDYHSMLNAQGETTNTTLPVVIGDHVWLTNQIMVLKGVTIGEGAIVSPFALVRKDVQPKAMFVKRDEMIVVKDDVHWSSKRVPDWGYNNLKK